MRKKGLYFFDVPIYKREIAILVDLSHSEAIAAAKKQKCLRRFIACFDDEELKDLIDKIHNDKEATEAAVRRIEVRIFLILRKPKNTWFFWDVLNHETFHISQFISHQLKMWDDIEPPAYLHSWLFEQLRHFLFNSKK